MKNKALMIGKLAILASTLPLWFLKLFVGIGHLLNSETGEIMKVEFRHSLYENICDGIHPALAVIAVAVTVIAMALQGIWLKKDNKNLQIVSNLAFGVSLGLFGILFLCGATVARGY